MFLDPNFGDNLKVYMETLSYDQKVDLINPYLNNTNNSALGMQNNASEFKTQSQIKNNANNEPSKWHHVLEFVFFLIPLIIYVGIYFLRVFVSAIGISVISPYYTNGFNVANYTSGVATSVSQPSFTTINVIKSIVYGWVFWKFSNVVAIFDMMTTLATWKKVVGFFSFFIVLCGLDSVIFILANQYAYDAIFVGASMLLALLITGLLYIGHQQKFHVTLRNAVLPYLSYGFIVAVYWIVLPQIYKVVLLLPAPFKLTAFYFIFPFIDTLLILFNRLIQYGVSEEMKLFVSTANNWLLQGYRVGVMLTANFTEAQFYYMVFFIVFRNIFLNYGLNYSKSDRMNISMTGWILVFYFSYVLNFVPICGVMNIITSTYYETYVASIKPIVWSFNPYTTTYSSITGVNLMFWGNILWWSPLIIWIASTFTQKYHLYIFNWKMLLYNFMGIYLFYEGLISGLFLPYLTTNAPF